MSSSWPLQSQGSSTTISALHSRDRGFLISISETHWGLHMVAWEQQHCRIPASVPLGSLAAGKACPCSRMESVVAQFVTMLAHQSVCQTVVAFFASLMGPFNSGPALSCYVATASVLGTDDCHMLQQLKSMLQIMVVCDSNSHTKCSEFCAGLRSCATGFG